MPNCDWYGDSEDHIAILDFLFGDATCEVYQAHSDLNAPLKQFQSTPEVMAEFDSAYPNGNPRALVFLLLRLPQYAPPLSIQRIELNPDKFPQGAHRFKAVGLGFIGLQLQRAVGNRLAASHSNHNSLKRAEAWEGIGNPERAAQWDFAAIAKFSARLNRVIRGQAVAKIGVRGVAPNALARWNAGVAFDQHFSKAKTPDLLKLR